MKTLLLLSIATLFFVEEPSYNFGGRYTKEDGLTLTIDVKDGSYWATFSGKNGNEATPCELAEKASVKQGRLHIRHNQGKQVFVLIISEANHTNTMVVRGLRKSDQASLTHVCTGNSLAGDYTRVPQN